MSGMRKLIRDLRAQGWRIRNGGWPATLAAEARWDFCLTRDSGGILTLFPHDA
jgi:hypothetical protein